MIRGVLCDIEGTTTSLAFAKDVLFPISRKEMDSFVHDHWEDPELRPLFAQLNKKDPGEVVLLLQSWIDADKKEGALKEIQGKIWKKSFETGQIRSHIYPDVPKKWSEWKDRGIRIYIFSSGSIEAQQLIFRYSEAGDLTSHIDGYFDTTIGAKKEAASYQKIADAVRLNANEMQFLSDVVAELDAARETGMQTVHIIREEGIGRGNHPLARTFEDL